LRENFRYAIRFSSQAAQLSEVAVNYAPDGRIVGIEVLDASEYVFARQPERKVFVQNLESVPVGATAP
jgi:hypothetical protein